MFNIVSIHLNVPFILYTDTSFDILYQVGWDLK